MDEEESNGFTALILSAAEGAADVAALLLAAGAQPSRGCRGRGGMTALHLAAGLGHTTFVGVLLDAGVPYDSVDARQRTALMHSTANARPGAAWLLLCSGRGPPC